MAHTHHLLLSLAGRVDDDLLATARELVAVGEEPQALEILVATLVADRTPLPAAVRAQVVELSSGLEVDAGELAPAGESRTHVFGSGPQTRLPELVATAAPTGSTARVTWRNTPAGGAPGPVPHPVVLVELGEGSYAPEVVSYRLGAHLARAGFPASVEAYTPADELPAYHRAALVAAGAQRPSPVPREAPLPADVPADVPSDVPEEVPPTAPVSAVAAPLDGRSAPDGGSAQPDLAPGHGRPEAPRAQTRTDPVGPPAEFVSPEGRAGFDHERRNGLPPAGVEQPAGLAARVRPTGFEQPADGDAGLPTEPGRSAGPEQRNGLAEQGPPTAFEQPRDVAAQGRDAGFEQPDDLTAQGPSGGPEQRNGLAAHVPPAGFEQPHGLAEQGPPTAFEQPHDVAAEGRDAGFVRPDDLTAQGRSAGLEQRNGLAPHVPPAAFEQPYGVAAQGRDAGFERPDDLAAQGQSAERFDGLTAQGRDAGFERPDHLAGPAESGRPNGFDTPARDAGFEPDGRTPQAPTDQGPRPVQGGPRPQLGAPVAAGEPPAEFRVLRPVPRPSPVARTESGLPETGAAAPGREEPPTAPYGTERARRSGPSLRVVPPVPGQEADHGPRPAPVTRPTPVVPSDAEPTPMQAWPVATSTEDPDPPVLASMHDPLSGPLREPLLAAQLDRADTGPVAVPPTSADADAPALSRYSNPSFSGGSEPTDTTTATAAEQDHIEVSPLPDAGLPDAPVESPARPPERSWTQDWASGAWAMPPRRETPAADTAESTRPEPPRIDASDEEHPEAEAPDVLESEERRQLGTPTGTARPGPDRADSAPDEIPVSRTEKTGRRTGSAEHTDGALTGGALTERGLTGSGLARGTHTDSAPTGDLAGNTHTHSAPTGSDLAGGTHTDSAVAEDDLAGGTHTHSAPTGSDLAGGTHTDSAAAEDDLAGRDHVGRDRVGRDHAAAETGPAGSAFGAADESDTDSQNLDNEEADARSGLLAADVLGVGSTPGSTPGDAVGPDLRDPDPEPHPGDPDPAGADAATADDGTPLASGPETGPRRAHRRRADREDPTAPGDEVPTDPADLEVPRATDSSGDPSDGPDADPSVAADDAPTGRRAAVDGAPTIQALPGGRRRARHRPDDADPWGFTADRTPDRPTGDDGLPPPRPVPRTIPRVRRAATGSDGAGGLFGPGEVPPARADGPFGTGPRPGNPAEPGDRGSEDGHTPEDELNGMSRTFEAPAADSLASLSSREQELLRRLHQELAVREEQPDQRRNGSEH